MLRMDAVYKSWCRRFALSVLAVLCGLLVFPGAFANDKKEDQAAAQALLGRAARVTNLEATGAAPFLLVAKTSWTQYGKTTDGQFALAWQAPDRYRRETTLAGFFEAEVVAGNALYRTRNLEYIPLAMVRPAALLKVASTFTNWPRTEMKMETDPPPKGLAGTSHFLCIAAVTEFNRASVRHVACFDNATGAPLIEQQQLSSGGTETITYADYAPVNGKQFPRSIKYEDSVGVRGDVEITKIAATASFPDATFQQPAQSIEQLWCAAPKVINAPTPSWAFDNWLKWGPEPEREWTPGRALQLDEPVAFVAVNAKGKVQSAVLLDDPPNARERTAVSLMRKDSFPVQACGKEPVPYEALVRLIRTSEHLLNGQIVERPLTN